MGTAIKHLVLDRVKPSFVILDIRALWRSGLSVRVPGYGNSRPQRVNVRSSLEFVINSQYISLGGSAIFDAMLFLCRLLYACRTYLSLSHPVEYLVMTAGRSVEGIICLNN